VCCPLCLLQRGARARRCAQVQVRELMAVVDQVMQRMREMYSADHHIGDMALGSIMQFVYRKLRCVECARVRV